MKSHGRLSLALRLDLGYVFVQPECLALLAEGQKDQGPTLLVGLSGQSAYSQFSVSVGLSR